MDWIVRWPSSSPPSSSYSQILLVVVVVVARDDTDTVVPEANTEVATVASLVAVAVAITALAIAVSLLLLLWVRRLWSPPLLLLCLVLLLVE